MEQENTGTNKGLSAGTILELAYRAEDCLVHSNSLLKSKVQRDGAPVAEAQWALFLETQPSSTSIESCAVSLGGSALLATGERVDSEIVQEAARLVARLQRADGGWTSFFPTLEEESLTNEAFFAIPFLIKADPIKYHESIVKGIEWLVKIENPINGGWGFFAGDSSHVLSTSFAIRVITEWSRLGNDHVTIRDTISRGLTWLTDSQNDDGSWSVVPKQNGSATQTSVALLALIAPGLFRHYSTPVTRGRNWLLDNLSNRDGVVDNYKVPKRDVDGKVTGFHRRISHVTFPEGIMLQALLLSGADLMDRRLLDLANGLIESQARDGSWKCGFVPYEKPIYAVLDACLALSQFTTQVKESENTLEIKEQIVAVGNRFTEFEHMNDTLATLNDTVRAQHQSLQQLSATLQEHQQDLKYIQRIVGGLFWLRPIAAVGNLVWKYPLIALLVTIVIVYVWMKIFLDIASKWSDIGIFVVGGLLLLLEIIQYYRSKGNK